MERRNDFIDRFSKLNSINLTPMEHEQVWLGVEERIQQVQPKRRRTHRTDLLSGFVAAVAAVAIVAGGFYAFTKHKTMNLSETYGTGLQFNQPAELVMPNWRLVIYPSLLKQGPYYEIQIFYEGQKPIPATPVTLSWAGIRASTAATSIQPGSLVSGLSVESFSQGFAKTPPLTLSWKEGGQSRTQKFVLSEAKPDLQVQNFHEYQGHDSKWSVTYEYETIVGSGFRHPYGILEVKYDGKQMGESVSFTLDSNAGTQHMSSSSSNPARDLIRLNVDPTQKGYDITSSNASITIQSSSGTDTVMLIQKK
ncbi:hypothetical protein JZ785_07145 [Alicyclobacillus curvatus]|nr:hypothetical protein JZ785_07145 [Alicyclobacillus curvatus]